MKQKKTNAARRLDELKIAYRLMEYTVDEEHLDAVHVAAEVGMPAAQVFKTLVVRGDKTGVIFACIPGDGELDLKALAKASGNKRRAGAFKRGTAADWLYSRRLFAIGG